MYNLYTCAWKRHNMIFYSLEHVNILKPLGAHQCISSVWEYLLLEPVLRMRVGTNVLGKLCLNRIISTIVIFSKIAVLQSCMHALLKFGVI